MNDHSQLTNAEKEKEYNVFRDSALRYAGYANEVGESFRYQFPRFVLPSYVVSFGYCLSDAAVMGYHCYQRERSKQEGHDHWDPARARNETLRVTTDALLWQTLASVLVPGASINTIVRFSRSAVQVACNSGVAQRLFPLLLTHETFKTWFPTAVGLGTIPLIVEPIDQLVDGILDYSLRSVWKGQDE